MASPATRPLSGAGFTSGTMVSCAGLVLSFIVTFAAAAPSITSIVPNQGSVGGGTRVTVRGTNLGNLASSTYDISIGGTPCALEAYFSTENAITCISGAHSASSWLPVSITVDGVAATCAGSCVYAYSSSLSGSTRSVRPVEVSSGQKLRYQGNVISSNPDAVTVRLGNYVCQWQGDVDGRTDSPWNAPEGEGLETYVANSDVDVPSALPTTSGWMWYWCAPEALEAGYYALEATTAGYGDASNEAGSWVVSGSGTLFHQAVVPVITSISPRVGSLVGGTRVTITGTGFAYANSSNVVRVGSTPCAVVESSLTRIVCILDTPTVRASPLGAANTTAWVSGPRGVLRDLYSGLPTGVGTIADLAASNAFATGAASSRSILPIFELPSTYDTGFGDSLTTVFTPQATGWYTFYIASDDEAQLFLQNRTGTPISDLSDVSVGFEMPAVPPISSRIASCPQAVGYRNYAGFAQQKSDKIFMQVGLGYVLRVLHRQATGPAYLSVAVKLSTSRWNAASGVVGAVDEVQTVSLAVTQLNQIDTVALTPGTSSGQFALSLTTNGTSKVTAPLAATASPAVVQGALNALLTANCTYRYPAGNKFFDLDNFETAVDAWGARDIGSPSIQKRPFCGTSSQHFDVGWGRNFEGGTVEPGQSSWYDLWSFPFMCGAWRIPPTTIVNMLIYTNISGWMSIGMTQPIGATQSYPRVADWGFSARGLNDGNWHYSCINLRQQVVSTFGNRPVGINAVILYTNWNGNPAEVSGPLDLDEFSISSQSLWVEQTPEEAAWRAGWTPGFDLNPFVVTNATAVTAAGTQRAWNVEWKPLDCNVDNSLSLGLVDYTLGTAATYIPGTSQPAADPQGAVGRVRDASQPLAGVLGLSFGGSAFVNVSATANASAFSTALAATKLAGSVAVTRSGTCNAYTWALTFQSLPGDQPPLIADTTYTLGNNLQSSVVEVVAGGLLINPIRGDLLRVPVPAVAPQLTVSTNGILASCQAAWNWSALTNTRAVGGCGLTASATSTPTVESVAPLTAHAGDTVTFTGVNFVRGGQYTITYRGLHCEVSTSTTTSVSCVLTVPVRGAAGTRYGSPPQLQFAINPAGNAEVALAADLILTSAVETPGGGGYLVSVLGGEQVTLGGYGFPDRADSVNASFVLTDGSVYSAPVTSSAYSSVVLTAPNVPTGSTTADIRLAFTDANGVATVLTAGVTFQAPPATPIVTGIDPLWGGAGGGTIVSLTVSNLDEATAVALLAYPFPHASVTIGSLPCMYLKTVAGPAEDGTATLECSSPPVGIAELDESGSTQRSVSLAIEGVTARSVHTFEYILSVDSVDVLPFAASSDAPTAVDTHAGTVPPGGRRLMETGVGSHGSHPNDAIPYDHEHAAHILRGSGGGRSLQVATGPTYVGSLAGGRLLRFQGKGFTTAVGVEVTFTAADCADATPISAVVQNVTAQGKNAQLVVVQPSLLDPSAGSCSSNPVWARILLGHFGAAFATPAGVWTFDTQDNVVLPPDGYAANPHAFINSTDPARLLVRNRGRLGGLGNAVAAVEGTGAPSVSGLTPSQPDQLAPYWGSAGSFSTGTYARVPYRAVWNTGTFSLRIVVRLPDIPLGGSYENVRLVDSSSLQFNASASPVGFFLGVTSCNTWVFALAKNSSVGGRPFPSDCLSGNSTFASYAAAAGWVIATAPVKVEGGWSEVVAVYNAATAVASLYVNGRSAGSTGRFTRGDSFLPNAMPTRGLADLLLGASTFAAPTGAESYTLGEVQVFDDVAMTGATVRSMHDAVTTDVRFNIAITVNGGANVCASGGSCRTFVSQNATPAVYGFLPVTGSRGTTVVLEGIRFDSMDAAFPPIVSFGDVNATLLAGNTSVLVVTVPNIPLGNTSVSVFVPYVGYAVNNPSVGLKFPPARNFTFENVLSVGGLSPAAGSLRGGQTISLSGNFGKINPTTAVYEVVLPGGVRCDIVSASLTPSSLSCVTRDFVSQKDTSVSTPVASNATIGEYSGAIRMRVTQPSSVYPYTTTFTAWGPTFTYALALTPTIAAVTPLRGTPTSLVNISGSGFGFDVAGVVVRFGAQTASIVSVSDDLVVCSAPAGYGVVPLTLTVLATGSPTLLPGVSSPISFIYEVVISSVTPSTLSSLAEAGSCVRVTGTGFASGAGDVLMLGDAPCTLDTTASNSNTQLFCFTPSAQAAFSSALKFTFGVGSTTGTWATRPAGAAAWSVGATQSLLAPAINIAATNLTANPNGLRAAARSIFVLDTPNAGNLSDYEATFNVLLNLDGAAGVVFMYRNVNTYYTVAIDNKFGFVALFRVENGTSVRLAYASAAAPVPPGVWSALALRLVDDGITVRVNGVTVLTFDRASEGATRLTRQASIGTFGYISWDVRQARYANLVLTPFGGGVARVDAATTPLAPSYLPNQGVVPAWYQFKGTDGRTTTILSPTASTVNVYFNDTVAAVVRSISPARAAPGDTLVLTGAHLRLLGGAAPVITLGGKLVTQIASSNATTIIFRLPALPSGVYPLVLNVSFGATVWALALNPNSEVSVTVTSTVLAVPLSMYGSPAGRNILRINGTGLPDVTSPDVSITVCGVPCLPTTQLAQYQRANAGNARGDGSSINCVTQPIIPPPATFSALNKLTVMAFDQHDVVQDALPTGLGIDVWGTETVFTDGAVTLMRFSNISLPLYATITSARLFITSTRSGGANDDCRLLIGALDGSDAFDAGMWVQDVARVYTNATAAALAGVPVRTTTTASWSLDTFSASGISYRSPDLTDVVNDALSDRTSATVAGSAASLVLHVTAAKNAGAVLPGVAPTRYVANANTPASIFGSAYMRNFAPRLEIEYTVPVATSTQVRSTIEDAASASGNCPVDIRRSATPFAVAAPGTVPGPLRYHSSASGTYPDATRRYTADKASDGVSTSLWLSPSASLQAAAYAAALPVTFTAEFGQSVRLDSASVSWWRVPTSFRVETSPNGLNWSVAFEQVAGRPSVSQVLFPNVVCNFARLVFVTSDEATHLRFGMYELVWVGQPIEAGSVASVTGARLLGGASDSSARALAGTLPVTPTLTSVAPNRGSTAGGTVVTIRGTNFGTSAGLNVTLAGAPCTLISVNVSVIVCKTTPSPPMLARGSVSVVWVGVGAAAAANHANNWYQYIDRWSAWTTWGGTAPPIEGDSVVIPAGNIILLDVTPPPLVAMVIQGALVFDDVDLGLTAQYILVMGGSFTIGTAEQPYLHNAVVTLTGHVKTLELPIFGTKVLAVHHGVLDLHGAPHSRIWTRIAASAASGTNVLYLQEGVTWPVGSQIVVTTTSQAQSESEEAVIASVSTDGRTVTLVDPLSYSHEFDVFEYANGKTIQISAEVALLSHNIRIQGDEQSVAPNAFGAHVMLHTMGDNAVIGRIENVEFFRVGQAFRLGRYPVHFHMIGSVTESYIKRVTVHESYNRGFTVHGVHYMTIEGSVAYKVMGHVVFVEDAIEMANTLKDILVIGTTPSRALLNSDQTPAAFWITNPSQFISGCAAVGSSNYGFWYKAETAVSGGAAAAGLGVGLVPQNIPLGLFENNVAHSNGRYGLRIYDKYTPTVPAVFKRFTSYRNNANGVTVTAGNMLSFEDFAVADNAAAGFEFASAQGGFIGGDWSLNQVRNSLIIGATPTYAAVMDGGQAFGIFGPADHGLMFTNVVFAGFDHANLWALRACAKCERFTPTDGGWETRFQNITWDSSPNRVYWRWEHESVWVDLDGTLSGTSDNALIVKPVALVPKVRLTRLFPACYASASYNGGYGGAICPGVAFRRFGLNAPVPTSLMYKDMVLAAGNYSTVVPWKLKRRVNPSGWTALLPVGIDYTLSWDVPVAQRQDVTNFAFNIGEMRPQERLTFGYNFLQLPDHLTITGPSGTRKTPSPARPYAAVGTNTSAVWGAWYLDDEVNAGFWQTPATWTDSRRSTVTSSWSSSMCPEAGCPIARPCQATRTVSRETFTRAWSDAATWTALGRAHAPLAGENVTIPWQFHILLDVSPPPLTSLWIEGRLTFEDRGMESETLILTAAQIIVRHEARLTIGSLSAPYEGEARVRLVGDKVYRGVGFGNTWAPSKSLVVLGELRMVSAFNKVDWVKLALPAVAGATTITVAADVDWTGRDELVLTPTGFEATEYENVTVADTFSNGDGTSTLALTTALKYNHGASVQSYGRWSVSTTGEVGLLTRNIVVEGWDIPSINGRTIVPSQTEAYGGRMLVTRDALDECVTYEGGAYVQGVRFNNMGAHGLDYTSGEGAALTLRALGLTNPAPPAATSHSVQHCSFSWLHHSGVAVVGASKNINVDSNVIVRPVGSGIRVDTGATGVAVTNNLVAGMLAPNYYFVVELQSVILYGAIDVRSAANTASGNVVGGSEQMGLYLMPEPCNSASKTALWYFDNEVHSALFGVWYDDSVSFPCAQLQRTTTWKTWDFGFFAYITPSLRIDKFVSVDAHVGFHANIYLPEATSHVRGDKYLAVTNSLFVGVSTPTSCRDAPPRHPWKYGLPASGFNEIGRTGVMFTTFASGPPESMDMAPPWNIATYPAISGLSTFTGVTFANYKRDACGFTNPALSANYGSPDAMHPIHLSNSTLVNVEEDSKVRLYRPKSSEINQDDCVDQACDGQKEVLINDLDHTFTNVTAGAGAGYKSSIFGAAEFMYAQESGTLVPIPMLTRSNGTRISEADLSIGRGIARIVSANPATSPCVYNPSWLAWRCHSPMRHRMLVIESMDPDTELRRLSAVAILSRGTGDISDPALRQEALGGGGNSGNGNGGGYMNLVAGPQDHGWCSGYTCLKRISTFYSVVATPQYYTIYLQSTNPDTMRYHLLNADASDGLVFAMWYQKPQKLVVYINGVQVEDMNYFNGAHRSTLPGGVTYVDQYPTPASPSGTNAYYRLARTIHVAVKGPSVVEIKQLPIIQVSLTLAISVEQFYADQATFVTNMAFVLNIPISRIRIVRIVAGSAQVDFQVLPPPSLIPTSIPVAGTAASLNSAQVYQSLANITSTLLAAALDGSLQSNLGPSLQVEGMSVQPPPAPVVVSANGTANASLSVVSADEVSLGKGVLRLTSALLSASEQRNTFVVTVSRDNGTFGVVNASYTTFDIATGIDDTAGSASAGSAYVATSGTLRFAAGQSTANFTVTLLGDNGVFDYPPPLFGVRLTGATGGAVIGSLGESRVQLVDSSTPSTVAVSNLNTLSAVPTIPTIGDLSPSPLHCLASGTTTVVVELTRSGPLTNTARLALRLTPPTTPAGLGALVTLSGAGSAAVVGVDVYDTIFNATFAVGQSRAQVALSLPPHFRSQSTIAELTLLRTRNVVPSAELTASIVVCIGPSTNEAAAASNSNVIVGGAVGGTLAFLVVVGGVLFMMRGRNGRNRVQSSSGSGGASPNKSLSFTSARKLASVTPIHTNTEDAGFSVNNPTHHAAAHARRGSASSPRSPVASGARMAFGSPQVTRRMSRQHDITPSYTNPLAQPSARPTTPVNGAGSAFKSATATTPRGHATVAQVTLAVKKSPRGVR